MKTISNRIIRKLRPCYDPSEVVKDENEELPVKEWVAKYRDLVKDKSDIIWLLCNKLYMSSKDMRLFEVWRAREALRIMESPDERSVEACNVAERYANGEATIEELDAAHEDARGAADAVWAVGAAVAAVEVAFECAAEFAWRAASAAAKATDRDAALAARAASAAAGAWDAAWYATRDAQIDQLMTYF